MSSEEFEKLHEMYKHIYNDIKSMPEIAAKCRGEEKKRVVREFDEKSGEAEEVLKGMDEELLLAPSSFRNPMSTMMRMYRRDLGKLQRDMKSTDLGLGFGARGESKYGAYTAENEHSVRDGRAALPKKLQLNNKTSRRNH